MSVAPMLSMSSNNTSNTSLTRHLDNPVPAPILDLDYLYVANANNTADPISRSNTPQPNTSSSSNNNNNNNNNNNTARKPIIILGSPSAGTIAQRRLLTRAIRSLAQRQLRTHISTTSLSHRLEQQRESSSNRSRHRSPSRSRDLQLHLEKSHEGSAIALRRCQNRALRMKRRVSSRLGHGHSLAHSPAPQGQTAIAAAAGGGHGQRVLVKKASKIGSEMMFFGEFKANPSRQWFGGCVVS